MAKWEDSIGDVKALSQVGSGKGTWIPMTNVKCIDLTPLRLPDPIAFTGGALRRAVAADEVAGGLTVVDEAIRAPWEPAGCRLAGDARQPGSAHIGGSARVSQEQD